MLPIQHSADTLAAAQTRALFVAKVMSVLAVQIVYSHFIDPNFMQLVMRASQFVCLLCMYSLTSPQYVLLRIIKANANIAMMEMVSKQMLVVMIIASNIPFLILHATPHKSTAVLLNFLEPGFCTVC